MSIQVCVRGYLARQWKAQLEEERLQRLVEAKRQEEARAHVERQLMRKEEMYMIDLRDKEKRAIKVLDSTGRRRK